MPGDVKPTRPYHSPRHAAMRRQTRAAVVEAARTLFADRGYAATTIDAIAEEAGVAVQTVYAAFGNKRSVLWSLLETAAVGDDAPASLAERAGEALAGIAKPDDRLHTLLAFVRALVERSADVHRVMRGAAAADPDVRQALEEAERRRYADALAFIDLVDSDRTPAVRRRAADVLFAVASYEMYDLLVVQRGWSGARWERWISTTVQDALGGEP